MAKKTYTMEQIETPVTTPDVRHQRITVSQNVTQESSFTIADLEHQIENCDQQIVNLETRKAELEVQISEAKAALSIE